ncbi:thermonuclease family protein [Diaphorobacter sp. ED-3]|uniref:thermonuclease family protein n=1 Tax=Diaphorobacter sp. ED-3 TaxID=3016636 RepID=UPI0022DDA02F|nr:thermonuclease family protein [Diaphorobacter sp. ED-3]
MGLPSLILCLVVGISDGDTLTARCGEPGQYEQVKVRLAGIDAPERKQPYGTRARQALAELTFQKQAKLDCPKTDRYLRKVCTVWVAPTSVPDGPQTLDAGLAMVAQGMAWWYRAYSRDQTPEARGQYEFAEQEARAKRVGLWADREAVAPWEWRKLARPS